MLWVQIKEIGNPKYFNTKYVLWMELANTYVIFLLVFVSLY